MNVILDGKGGFAAVIQGPEMSSPGLWRGLSAATATLLRGRNRETGRGESSDSGPQRRL